MRCRRDQGRCGRILRMVRIEPRKGEALPFQPEVPWIEVACWCEKHRFVDGVDPSDLPPDPSRALQLPDKEPGVPILFGKTFLLFSKSEVIRSLSMLRLIVLCSATGTVLVRAQMSVRTNRSAEFSVPLFNETQSMASELSMASHEACLSPLPPLGTPPGYAHIMNLLCQGAGGLWTGLGWATPCGGQALIRSHGPPRGCGWGSTGHYQDSGLRPRQPV